MKVKRAFIVGASVVASQSLLHASPIPQQQPAIQQLQNMQQQQLQLQAPSPELRTGTNAPELYSGENADIGPQRILQVGPNARPRRNYFDGQLDTQVFFTDNANYSGPSTARIESWVFVNTAMLAFAPDPYDLGPGKFSPSLGFSSQWYNYSSGRMKPLDFDAQTVFANLRYVLGKWQFDTGANYTRLLAQDAHTIGPVSYSAYSETYREWLPYLSVQRVLPVNDAVALIVGDSLSYHCTRVAPNSAARDDVNDHLDDTLFLTLNWQITSHLCAQPFYRFEYCYYRHDTLLDGGRNDYLNSFGLNLVYSFNQHVSLRTFYSYTTVRTDDLYASTYDEVNGGLGATLDVRF
jgi:hypothetical protein